MPEHRLFHALLIGVAASVVAMWVAITLTLFITVDPHLHGTAVAGTLASILTLSMAAVAWTLVEDLLAARAIRPYVEVSLLTHGGERG